MAKYKSPKEAAKIFEGLVKTMVSHKQSNSLPLSGNPARLKYNVRNKLITLYKEAGKSKPIPIKKQEYSIRIKCSLNDRQTISLVLNGDGERIIPLQKDKLRYAIRMDNSGLKYVDSIHFIAREKMLQNDLTISVSISKKAKGKTKKPVAI